MAGRVGSEEGASPCFGRTLVSRRPLSLFSAARHGIGVGPGGTLGVGLGVNPGEALGVGPGGGLGRELSGGLDHFLSVTVDP